MLSGYCVYLNVYVEQIPVRCIMNKFVPIGAWETNMFVLVFPMSIDTFNNTQIKRCMFFDRSIVDFRAMFGYVVFAMHGTYSNYCCALGRTSKTDFLCVLVERVLHRNARKCAKTNYL